MAEPERALFLPSLEPQFEIPQGIDRLYLGAEFCCWALPSAAQLMPALHTARRQGIAVTLVLPVLYESFLPRLREFLAAISSCLGDRDEIVISDWGAFAPARELCPDTEIVLGRTLSGQKRGAEILDLALSSQARDYFRRGSWYSGPSRALLAEHGITRVELDNLFQGVVPLPRGLRGTLHYPFLFVTSSRNCPNREIGDTGPCSTDCHGDFRLSSPRAPLPLLQRGNTQFAENEVLPPFPTRLGIDRLVFHPRLPR